MPDRSDLSGIFERNLEDPHPEGHILHAQCHLMDIEETAAPFPEGEKGGGDIGVGERVPYDGGEQFQKSEHTRLKRTSCEKK